ncbi:MULTISPECIES: hypothetical protein [Cupriavidus]|uniref:hypothetical protein n=1 Tax=Cupriavidus TaxID=106589 RepID=UPI000465C0E3|nr:MULTISPECIES: hypothetical protein [Cupriavidus]KWR83194.1 hypothetical protein RN01_10010 [Cupriavidus sp. SHE]QWC87889.1 hypothetical protein KB891_12675 [Cupriavidus metallidurans]
MPIANSNAFPDAWRLSPKSIKLIGLAGVIGALCGFAVFHFVPPRWTARITVQVGQISSPEGGAVTSRLVENQLTAVDRYNLPSSRLKVLNELGLQAGSDSKESRLIFESLLGSPGKGPNLINLQVSAYSREQAVAAMSSSVKLLAAEHQKLLAPSISRMSGDLANLTDKLKAAERDYANSYAWLVANAKQKNDPINSVRDVQLTNLTMLADRQSVELRHRIMQFQEALDPTSSYPTRPMGEIFAPDRPSTPGWAVFVAAGAVFGLALGTLLVVQRLASRARKPDL